MISENTIVMFLPAGFVAVFKKDDSDFVDVDEYPDGTRTLHLNRLEPPKIFESVEKWKESINE